MREDATPTEPPSLPTLQRAKEGVPQYIKEGSTRPSENPMTLLKKTLGTYARDDY